MTHRLTISDTADKYLRKWLEALIAQELELWGLPPSVAAFYDAGFAEGRASRQHEIEALERQVNYLYYQLLPERERSEQIEQRLAERMQQAPAEWWDELETVLKNVVAGVSNEQSNSIRAEQHSADSGVQNDSSSTERSTKRAA